MNAEVKTLQFIIHRSDFRVSLFLLLMKTLRLSLILALFFSIYSTPAT